MIEDLKQVRDDVLELELSNNHYNMLLVQSIVTTLDRIIARGVVVPDGYKLVPIEPTKSFLWSGIENTEEFVNGDPWYGNEPLSDGQAEQCYKAMIAAAPQPQQIDVEALKREMTSHLVNRRDCHASIEADHIKNTINRLAEHYDFVRKV